MKHRKVLIIALTLMLVILALIVSPGCTRTLKAVIGACSYYEAIASEDT